MKENLSRAEVIDNGTVLAEQTVKNIPQAWKFMCAQKPVMPESAHLLVYREDGTVFKDYIVKETAVGRQLVNQVRETNRGQVAKARRLVVNATQHQEAAMIEAGLDPDTSEEFAPVQVQEAKTAKKAKKAKAKKA